MSIDDPKLQFTRGHLVDERFRIERELGRGAMGVVYMATQLDLDRPVALKVFSLVGAERKESDRLFNEARAAGALSHHGIVQVYSAGRAENHVGYFAMEYIAGETLGHRIKAEKRLSDKTALQLARQLAGGLKHGWQKLTLTHGDIKPENVMLTSGGDAKLADFGLARGAIGEQAEAELRLTPLYAAPELITGEWSEGDCRADIYSFGATLYHMIAGTPPFPGQNPKEVMRRQVHEELVPLARHVPSLPMPVSNFVGQLLQKTPGRRVATWQDVCDQLDALIASATKAPMKQTGTTPARSTSKKIHSPHPRPHHVARPQERSMGPLIRPLLLLALIALVLGVLLSIMIGRKGDPSSSTPRPSEHSSTAANQHRPTHTPSTPPQTDGNHKTTSPKNSAPGSTVDTARTVAEEKEMAPTSERRLDSLPNELAELEQQIENRKNQDEAPGETAENTPDSHNAENDSQDQAGPDHAKARAAVENYNQLLAQIGQTEWLPGENIPLSLKSRVNDWLGQHGTKAPRAERVLFLKQRVLPEADNYLHHLILQHENLRGKSLPGQLFKGLKLLKVTRNGLDLARVSRYGHSTRSFPWERLRSRALRLHLGSLAFPIAADLPVAELRPYMAVLLLSGAEEDLEEILTHRSQDKEILLWNELANDLSGVFVERRASALWRAAREAHANGDKEKAFALIRALRALPTEIVQTYAEQIARIESEYRKTAPDHQANAMVAKAAALADEHPYEALLAIGRIQTRHGGTNFAEKRRVEHLRAQCLRTILHPVHFSPLVAPKSPLTANAVYCLRRMRQLTRHKHTDNSTPETAKTKPLLYALRTAFLLYTGDWSPPHNTLDSDLMDQIEFADAADRAAILTAKLRADARLGTSDEQWLEGLTQLVDLAEDHRKRAKHRHQRYANAFAIALEADRPASRLWKEKHNSEQRRFGAYWEPETQIELLLRFAWLVEHGHRRTTAEPLKTLAHTANNADSLPPGPFIPAVHMLAESARGGACPTPQQLPEENHKILPAIYRAGVSEMLARNPESVLQDADFPSIVQMKNLLGHGALSSSLWRDLALIGLARALANGDTAAAASWLNQCLAEQHPDTSACYTDLLFHLAGVQLLAQQHASVMETLRKIVDAGTATHAEQGLAVHWAAKCSGTPRRFSTTGKSERITYFKRWLEACNMASPQTRFQRTRCAEIMEETAPSLANAVLAQQMKILFSN